MDPDVFPNSLEYWGPTGMVLFRNVQLRWMPMTESSNVTLAISARAPVATRGYMPTASSSQNISARFPLPDFAAATSTTGKWGYVRAAGMLRLIKWDDTLRRRIRSVRRRDRVGMERQLEPQAHQE